MRILRLYLAALFVFCIGLLCTNASDAKPSSKETVPLHIRKQEFYKALSYVSYGDWEKALPVLEKFRGMCQSPDTVQNAAFASLLIASIYEEQDQIEKAKRE